MAERNTGGPFLSHLRSLTGYDEPETFSYAISSICPIGADGVHSRAPFGRLRSSDHLSARLTSPMDRNSNRRCAGGRVHGEVRAQGRFGTSSVCGGAFCTHSCRWHVGDGLGPSPMARRSGRQRRQPRSLLVSFGRAPPPRFLPRELEEFYVVLMAELIEAECLLWVKRGSPA